MADDLKSDDPKSGNLNSGDQEPSDLELLATMMQRRQLTTPFLLMLASHRPLTFVTGQLLYALAPFSALLGWEQASDWAAFLSAPNANQRLAEFLRE